MTPFDSWMQSLRDASYNDNSGLDPEAFAQSQYAQMLRNQGRDPNTTPDQLRAEGWHPTGQPDNDGGFLGTDGLTILGMLGGAGAGQYLAGAGLAGSAQLPFGENAFLASEGAVPGAAAAGGALGGIPGGGGIMQVLSALGLSGLSGAGGFAPTGGAGGGFDISKLLPLLGVGSGLSTMFNRQPAVDPSRVNALWQAGQNTYNASLDPQSQLHDFLQQQTVDASRAGTGARGIGMSPYAAGLENDATRNFNMNWQNQQLARQAQGTQAFAQAGDTAARSGIANNAQAFNQNQTGLNNLTTGLGQIFGQNGLFGPSATPGADPGLGWLSSFGGGGAQGGSTSYNPFPMGGTTAQDIPS